MMKNHHSKYAIVCDPLTPGDIQELLFKIRIEHLKMTREEVAKDMNLSVKTLENYEASKTSKISLETIKRFCKKYNLSLNLTVKEI